MQKAGALLVTAYPPQNKREALETICAAVREFTEHEDTPVDAFTYEAVAADESELPSYE